MFQINMPISFPNRFMNSYWFVYMNTITCNEYADTIKSINIIKQFAA